MVRWSILTLMKNNHMPFLYMTARKLHCTYTLGLKAQSVVSPTADPGVASLIQVQSHTFVEIMCTKYWLTA